MPRLRQTTRILIFAIPFGLLAAASALLLVLPRYRYSREALLAEVVFGAALFALWRFARRRPARRRHLLFRLAFAGVLLGLGGALVAGATTAVDDLGYWDRKTISDLGPSMSACGPLGLDAGRFGRLALARVRAAFPHEQVRIVRGCRQFDDAPGHEVRLRIGRFSAPGLATRLVVGETVRFGADPGSPTTLSPYVGEAAADVDLTRLDATAAVRKVLGNAPRLCLLDGGYGGFTLGWWLDCISLARAGQVAEVPGGWPEPAFARGCDGSGLYGSPCVQAQVAEPPAAVDLSSHRYRHLNDFDSPPTDGG